MLSALITGTGLMASAAVATVAGFSNKKMSEDAAKAVEDADLASKQDTKRVVSTLGPAVTTIGESLEDINKRVDEDNQQQATFTREVDMPLIDTVGTVATASKTMQGDIQSVNESVKTIQDRIAELDLRRRGELDNVVGKSDIERQYMSNMQLDIKSQKAAANYQYARVLQDVSRIRDSLTRAEKLSIAREAAQKAERAKTVEQRTLEEISRANDQRIKAEQSARDLIRAMKEEYSATNAAAAEQAKAQAMHASKMESRLLVELRSAREDSSRLRRAAEDLNEQFQKSVDENRVRWRTAKEQAETAAKERADLAANARAAKADALEISRKAAVDEAIEKTADLESERAAASLEAAHKVSAALR